MRGTEADTARLQGTIARGALRIGTEPAAFSAGLSTCFIFYTLGFGFCPPAVVVLHREAAGKREGEEEHAWLFCLVYYCKATAYDTHGGRVPRT